MVLAALLLFLETGLATAALSNPFKISEPGPGWFFTSVCRDRAGRLWLGTEDRGIVWWEPSAHSWNQACAPNTLDDVSVYSVACDAHGFIWVGTLNHGAAEFDGTSWKYFGQYDGLRGQHVIAIAVDHLDDSIWFATEAGISRRNDKTGSRTFFPTSVDGFLSPPTCLTFSPDGALFVGTLCDGILIASSSNDYAT